MPTSARAVRTVFTEICGEFDGSQRADVHPQGVGRIRSAPSSLTAALAIGPYKVRRKIAAGGTVAVSLQKRQFR